MDGKWFLRDWLAPQRVVVGVLRDVHRSGGVLGDDDTNLEISPDAAHQELLVNRNGVTNPEGVFGGVPDRYLECEINVGSDWRDEYEAWAR
jgi:hypothetical protein